MAASRSAWEQWGLPVWPKIFWRCEDALLFLLPHDIFFKVNYIMLITLQINVFGIKTLRNLLLSISVPIGVCT